LDWRRYLCGGGPRKIILRLVQGDPLGLRRVVSVRLARRALLLDADRVHLRAMTRIALGARDYDGHPAFSRWLERQVDGAMNELRDEESDSLEGVQSQSYEDCGADGRLPFECDVHEAIGGPLGIPAEASRQLCATFNRLPFQDRRTFLAVVLRAQPLDDLAQGSGRSVTQLARSARRVLDRLLLAAEPFPTAPQL